MSTRTRIAAAVALAAGLAAAPVAARAATTASGPNALDLGLPSLPTSAGRALIGFGTVPAGLDAGGTLAGLPVLQVDRTLRFAAVAAPTTGAVRSALAAAGIGSIRYVEDDVLLHTEAVPNDARYGEQYGPAMMGFPAAWDQVGYGSPSVKVGIVDSGVRKTHQDLTGGRLLQGHDYVNNDNDPNDDCGHGTHVTGTIAATTGNSTGVAGMSQATILMMKGLGSVGGLLSVQCTGNTSGIATAIHDAADQGVKIISMSIGGGGTTTLEDAVNYAWGKGVILVAAAGNDGAANSIDYPGAYDNVLAVAALDSTKAKASYSDMGPQLDIAAPGTDVLSTYNTNDSTYELLSGTSMATPHVAGALALAASCNPSATNVQLRSALLSTAEDLGTPGFDQSYGNGLARADRLVAALCSGGTTTTTTAPATTTTTAAPGTTTTTRPATTTTTKAPSDPDPSTPNLTSGSAVNVAVSAGSNGYFKVKVPAGTGTLTVAMTGPSCSVLSCSVDADLSTNPGSRPTDTTYACRPYTQGNAETCTQSAPTAGYWYVRINGYSGSGTVTLKATLS